MSLVQREDQVWLLTFALLLLITPSPTPFPLSLPAPTSRQVPFSLLFSHFSFWVCLISALSGPSYLIWGFLCIWIYDDEKSCLPELCKILNFQVQLIYGRTHSFHGTHRGILSCIQKISNQIQKQLQKMLDQICKQLKCDCKIILFQL